MQLSDSQIIRADREAVWAALQDAEVLKSCVMGCTEMVGSVEEGFDAVVVQKVGPVKATFRGRVEVQNRVPPESLTITGEGMGGPAGSAKGGADVRLEPQGAATMVHYTVVAEVGGKLAKIGAPVVNAFAKRMVDSFFANLKIALEPSDDTGRTEDGEGRRGGWFRRIIGG